LKLVVCLDGQVAGEIDATGGSLSFEYAESWLEDSGNYPLSNSMPLSSRPHTGAVISSFLWGLLPDNERTLDSWARRFRVSARNPAALLAHVGEDCAGAVQFVTEERLPNVLDAARGKPEVDWLTRQELDDRIQRLAKDGAASRYSAEEGQFSLAGAQTKTALHFDTQRGRWGIPRGRTPTTHILKPVANDFDGFAENEHFCLALTRRMGLAAAHTQWQVFGGVPTLIVERYDRIRVGGRWHRIHQEDFCQALAVQPGAKYENDGGPGFAQIMPLLDGTDEPETDRERMMKGACLIYLLAATDVHAKNYSLLRGPGTGRPSMRLAPFYDIASAWPYGRQLPAQKLKLAMRVGRHYRLRQIMPRHFEELARACRYPPERILEHLRTFSARLPDEASALLAEVTSKAMSRTSLSAVLDGIARESGLVRKYLGAS
jgi:serine/threonine-protein kinase HipA